MSGRHSPQDAADFHDSPAYTFPPSPWHGKWIWAPDSQPGDGRQVVALRHVLELDAVPESMPARMSAVSRYALWVNGIEVSRGPVRANPRRQPYDDLDLAPHLRPGVNVIAALVWRYDGAKPWWTPLSFLANDLHEGAFVFEAAGIGTGSHWQARALPGWGEEVSDRLSGRGVEHADTRSLPADWLTAAAVDWPRALTRRAVTTGEPGRAEPPSFPGGPLEPRPIGRPDPADVVLRSAGTAGPAHVHLAERIESGTLVVDASGPAGATVTVRVAEFLDADGLPAPSEHDACFAVTLDGTRRTTESLDLYGFRGALVETTAGAVVHELAVRTRTHPASGGTFQSSDPRVDQIWAVGRRTVTLCSSDAYIDCPTREQRAWVGDAVVHQMVDFATSTDWRLARWYPRLAASPRARGRTRACGRWRNVSART